MTTTDDVRADRNDRPHGRRTAPGEPAGGRQPDDDDGLARHQEDEAQPRAVLRRARAAAAVHRDVRLHLRRRGQRQRRQLPAGADPRDPGADDPDGLHRDRRAAARGHGQGRLRTLQGTADRSGGTSGRPHGRRPAPLHDRVRADLRHGHRDGLPARRRRLRRRHRDPADDHHRLVDGVDLHLRRDHRQERPVGAGHLDDDHVPADVPVQRLRPGRHPPRLVADVRPDQPGLARGHGRPRPRQRRAR